ncbi:MAG: DUF6580 family putative transport protein [Bacteroidia bacterium]
MKSLITSPRFLFISSALFIAAISRLFPHIPNFTPIAAMALFGGVYFTDKRIAIIVPLILMFITDCLLELTTGWGFHNTLIYVYIGFILTSIIGIYIKRNFTVQALLVGSLLSSTLFFVITNFGVWATMGCQMGAAGLATTYVLGIPFFAPTLIGDLFFNTILFGAFYLAERKLPLLIKA